MKYPVNFKQIYFSLRWLSKNTILGSIVPVKIQIIVSEFFKNPKKKAQLLRQEIIKYYEKNETCLDNKIKDSIDFLRKHKNGFCSLDFLKIWLGCNEKAEKYFEFGRTKLPDISHDVAQMKILLGVFPDTFLFPCLLNDNYDKALVEQFDPLMLEGPYGYTDIGFDVTIKKNDIVIDAGAWIGDFSAYAATSKGAKVYAFEPVNILYETLLKTVLINSGKIIPVKKALGNKNGEMVIVTPGKETYMSSLCLHRSGKKETIEVITLDDFVEREKIENVDFIKADIEGAERHMLMGAKKVLKEFAPKLAICTYHLPDDPEVLEKLVLDANPDYRIIHTSHKLFAMAKKQK